MSDIPKWSPDCAASFSEIKIFSIFWSVSQSVVRSFVRSISLEKPVEKNAKNESVRKSKEEKPSKSSFSFNIASISFVHAFATVYLHRN